MIRLRALGTVELLGDDGAHVPSVTAQPKRLALLVYLAAAWPRGFHRRDTLVGMFWPESSEERARGALGQALYFLRRSLGSDVILRRGNDEVAVAENRLWCDAAALREALHGGSPREALDLYRGDLLPGFHLPDARGFEEWLDGERSRLRRAVLDAANTHAAQIEASDPHLAADLLRRALRAGPDDEAVLRRLMTLLDAGGDRAAALAAFDEFARRVEVDYGVGPSPETLALRDAITARTLPLMVVPATAGRPEAPTRDAHPAPAPTRELEAAPPAADAQQPPTHDARRPVGDAPLRRRRVRMAATAAGFALVAVVLAAVAVGPDDGPPGERMTADGGAPARATCMPSGGEGSLAVPSPEAHAECLMGRHFLSKLTPDDFRTARAHFERAIDLDPTLADAWSGLSQAFIMLTTVMALPAPDAYPRAQAAADRALALEPDLAEGHATLAMSLAMYRWESDSAEHHFRRSVELDPGSAAIRRMYAAHLRNLGRFEEALTHIRVARELDPFFSFVHVEEGLTLFVSGHHADALAAYERYLRVNPDHIHVYVFVAMAHAALEQYEEALEALDTTDPAQLQPDAQAFRGVVLARMGDHDGARRMLRKLEDLARARTPVSPFHTASIHAALGEHDRALELLEQAVERPTWHLRLLKVIPTFEPLRDDPRFHALLESVGLS